jgi:hypothetical protein
VSDASCVITANADSLVGLSQLKCSQGLDPDVTGPRGVVVCGIDLERMDHRERSAESANVRSTVAALNQGSAGPRQSADFTSYDR